MPVELIQAGLSRFPHVIELQLAKPPKGRQGLFGEIVSNRYEIGAEMSPKRPRPNRRRWSDGSGR